MITLKLWNSLTDYCRREIVQILGYGNDLAIPYHHNFDFDRTGSRIKLILSCCNLQKDGTINVVVSIQPQYENQKATVKPVKKNETKKIVEKKEEWFTWIGYYYELNDDGERIDSFKEWCEARSREEAEQTLRNRYYGDKNVELSDVYREKQ